MNVLIIISLLLCWLIGTTAFAQNNLESLLDLVETGKTYALYPAKKGDENTIREDQTYYIRLVPPKYTTVYDTIELAPALNGNLDTSNYFIQTEILVLKEPNAAWKTATVSPMCRKEDGVPHLTLCLLKTTPDYKIIQRKFFPFKNIYDVSATDYIIPAETIVVERKVLSQRTAIYIITDPRKVELHPGEKMIKIPAGDWRRWAEITCPFGEFNDPSIVEIQTALKKQQYQVTVTNKFDEQTKRAIMEFQRDNMLEVGGLTDKTLERLGVNRERLISIDF